MERVFLNDIDSKYKYVLDRGNFGRMRSVQNVAFMLNKHLGDADASYLLSDTNKRLVDRAEAACLEDLYLKFGVAVDVVRHVTHDENCVPKDFTFEYNTSSREYSLDYVL